MNPPKIIFILPNIYECKNGVSTKYIHFINYLSDNFTITLFLPFKTNNYENYISNLNKINIVKCRGLKIPFYKDIIIPIINTEQLKKEIINGKEIIIFNGEFIWIYNILIQLKEEFINIKIYPTMHTDYLYYGKKIYKNYNVSFLLKHLELYLNKKIMSGILVTGEKMKEYYLNYTERVFNANEVNLNIFKNIKYDNYNNNFYNFIYCGRISKEKNVEEILDCLVKIKEEKINFILNIIGDGPFLNDFIYLIDLEYSIIKSNIIFHGAKEQKEINNIYQHLENRIFIFTSESETFGKTPMEAGVTGIPIFIKKSDITDYLYINKINAYIFDSPYHFIENFLIFKNLNNSEKKIFIDNSIQNIIKYDQEIIFENMISFILEKDIKKKENNLGFLDQFSLYSISKLINCTGNIFGE